MARANAARRGYDHQWRKASKAFLALNPYCAIRGEGCTILATLVDHVIPHRGDMELFWRDGNWQGLCDHCHNVHKQRLENQKPARDHRGRLLR